jgi:Na+/H+ antiporter NhaD/arsenite permease-like protein
LEIIVVLIFTVGYLAIALEHFVKINKTATALLTGIICWTLFAIDLPDQALLESQHYATVVSGIKDSIALNPDELYHVFVKTELSHSLSEIASILFFLMGAMTIVELIDAHDGFRFTTDRIGTRNVRKLLWIACWLTFLLSAVLDNLTASIVMVSLVRKLVYEKEKRWFFAGMIIIAANAGGAWSPIGDVTTTMLWIGGQVSAVGIIKALLVPSMICLLLP